MKPINLLMAALLASCVSNPAPRPDDMSAARHREEAVNERTAARDHLDRYDPHAISAMPAENDERYISQGVPARHGYYNPSDQQLTEAQRHLRHAEAHERAAAQLEGFEDQKCPGLPAETRAACPLLHDVLGLEDVRDGVRVRFTAAVDVAGTASLMQCHLAYARTRGYPIDDCPLYVRGVRVERVAGQPAIDILAGDAATATRIRALARDEISP